MSGPIHHRTAGDEDDTVVIRADGIDTLAGVTAVEAHIWPATRNPPTGIVTLTAAVTDATTREVTVQLGAAAGWLPGLAATVTVDTAFLYELEFMFGATGPLTWPGDRNELGTIVVRPQGD